MEDIVPELLNLIQNEFADAYEADKEITELIEKIDSGKATGADLDAYAARTGDLLAETLHRNISSDTLPDGRMYYNIANRILSPVLEKNYNLVADVAAAVQEQLNERAGIGIRPMKPEINRDRINGLVDLASDAEQYDDVSGQVESGVVNYTQSVATDAVHENAEFHYKAGLTPRIVRTAEAGCCQWCQDLAGTYDYQDVRSTGSDVYRRHRNCRCTVEYDPSNGSKRQNVHSKQYSWKEDNEPLIEQRKQIDEVDLFPNPIQMQVKAAWGLAATAQSPDGLTKLEELGRLPYENAEEIMALYGDAIRNQPVEHAILIQKDGLVLHFRCDSSNVGIFNAKLDGAYITHNHPKSNGIISFSWQDLEYYSKHPEISRMECVNEEYNYSMKLIAPISKDEYNKAYYTALEMIHYDGVEAEINDLTMCLLQEQGKVEYEARRLDGKV